MSIFKIRKLGGKATDSCKITHANYLNYILFYQIT